MEDVAKEISSIHTEMRKVRSKYLTKYKHSDEKLKRGPKKKVRKADCVSDNFSFVHELETTDKLCASSDDAGSTTGQSFMYTHVRIV